MAKTTYETTLRGKWIYGKANTFTKMIKALEDEIKLLNELKAAKCKLDTSSGEDDYFFIRTNDKTVAEKFGMEEQYNEEGSE